VAQIDRAVEAHQQGRLEEAAARYDEVIAAEPDNTQALRLRGVLARQCGDIGASIRLLETAYRLAPTDVTTANDLALSLMAAGDLQAAETALREALGRVRESPRALANLGALLQQRGHSAEAIAIHREYLELVPEDLEVRCNLAHALMDTGRADDAIEACDAALAIAPDHPLVLANKGAVLCGLDRCEAAVEVLRRALAANPDDDMALINLAYAQRALDNADAAIDSLTRAVRANPVNARAAADLANAWLGLGMADRAVEVCERFLASHPGDRLVLASYAYALRDAGRRADARRLLDFDRLIRIRDLGAPPGFADLAEFNRGLAQFVTGHASLLQDPVRKATTGGAQTGELNALESPVFGALDAELRRVIEQAVAEWLAEGFGGHELMANAADRWTLRTWGTVLNAGGHQAPHHHPLGWLSGVYYAGLPDSVDVGALEFGRPPDQIRPAAPPETFCVTPRPGRLVIFPSWFYHRTLPFDATGTRVSIAFDVMSL